MGNSEAAKHTCFELCIIPFTLAVRTVERKQCPGRVIWSFNELKPSRVQSCNDIRWVMQSYLVSIAVFIDECRGQAHGGSKSATITRSSQAASEVEDQAISMLFRRFLNASFAFLLHRTSFNIPMSRAYGSPPPPLFQTPTVKTHKTRQKLRRRIER
jgi:hypothetical protein